MKAAIRLSALARIFLVAGFGAALSAMPANAQKPGGSITFGLELDIPGFDPLKVGVFDTSSFVKNVSEHRFTQGVVAIGDDRVSITSRVKVPRTSGGAG